MQISSGLIRFRSFRVWVYIGSIRVRVSSDLVWFILGYRSIRFRIIVFDSDYIEFRVTSGHYSFWLVSVLGQLNFRFWIEIGSTFSPIGSDLISDRLV